MFARVRSEEHRAYICLRLSLDGRGRWRLSNTSPSVPFPSSCSCRLFPRKSSSARLGSALISIPAVLSGLGGPAPPQPHPASFHVHLVTPSSSGAGLRLTISTCVIARVHAPQVHVGPDRQLRFALCLSLSLTPRGTLQILHPCSRLINNGLVGQ